jgi:hypothetical protein
VLDERTEDDEGDVHAKHDDTHGAGQSPSSDASHEHRDDEDEEHHYHAAQQPLVAHLVRPVGYGEEQPG